MSFHNGRDPPDGEVLVRSATEHGKPHAFFDLGETIVNLRDTIGVIASTIGMEYPSIAMRAKDCAKAWFVGLASAVPRDPASKFESQYEVGRQVLARVLQGNGVPVKEEEAGRLLQTAWDRWQDRARLCEGVTKEWLREVGLLSAGVGAVTDGDEADVRRLLSRMNLSQYFDSVTTSEAVQAYKPNPVVYHRALASLGALPERSLFVSDSPLDLAGAIAVGMTAVWFHRGPREVSKGVPSQALQAKEPRDLNVILARFTETGHFESESRA